MIDPLLFSIFPSSFYSAFCKSRSFKVFDGFPSLSSLFFLLGRGYYGSWDSLHLENGFLFSFPRDGLTVLVTGLPFFFWTWTRPEFLSSDPLMHACFVLCVCFGLGLCMLLVGALLCDSFLDWLCFFPLVFHLILCKNSSCNIVLPELKDQYCCLSFSYML